MTERQRQRREYIPSLVHSTDAYKCQHWATWKPGQRIQSRSSIWMTVSWWFCLILKMYFFMTLDYSWKWNQYLVTNHSDFSWSACAEEGHLLSCFVDDVITSSAGWRSFLSTTVVGQGWFSFMIWQVNSMWSVCRSLMADSPKIITPNQGPCKTISVIGDPNLWKP